MSPVSLALLLLIDGDTNTDGRGGLVFARRRLPSTIDGEAEGRGQQARRRQPTPDRGAADVDDFETLRVRIV